MHRVQDGFLVARSTSDSMLRKAWFEPSAFSQRMLTNKRTLAAGGAHKAKNRYVNVAESIADMVRIQL